MNRISTPSNIVTYNVLADILGVSRRTLETWEGKRLIFPILYKDGSKHFDLEGLTDFPEIRSMLNSKWEEELHTLPVREYSSIELFAGAGGLAIGLEQAGFKHILLNEIDSHAANTLKTNRPEWNVVQGNVKDIDFTPFRGELDLLSGGFPCQSFSYAGHQRGLEDARGTLFFELARAVKESKPKVVLGENVKGLLSHDDGRTIGVIRSVLHEIGYTVVDPKVLKAIMYKVPQKRERLFIVAVRNDLADYVTEFAWPEPFEKVMTLRDAFFAGDLYPNDVPESEGQSYSAQKRHVLSHVPEGGNWNNLSEDLQREYMGASYFLGGGKTGMARRLSMDEPSLTLTCSPAQKQTERCHPWYTRPLTVREYARIQTFPDAWIFKGSVGAMYKQIGNAVPVNLAAAVGRALVRLLNIIEDH